MRSFNYTNRKKILRDDFSMLVTNSPNNDIVLEVVFPNFLLLGYDPSSKVLIEAYNRSTFMRFDCGIVDDISTSDRYILTNFCDIEDILFRIKVVSHQMSRLEGLADRVRPDCDKYTNNSIINIRSIDLSGAIWSIEFSEENPTVLLDKSIDKNLITSDSIFSGLVVPSVFREVLIRILVVERDLSINYEDAEGEDDWRMNWLIFCGQNSGSFLEQDQFEKMDIDDKYMWVDDMVAIFCRNKSMLNNLTNAIDGGL